jgi:hypothetical protein
MLKKIFVISREDEAVLQNLVRKQKVKGIDSNMSKLIREGIGLLKVRHNTTPLVNTAKNEQYIPNKEEKALEIKENNREDG